MGRGKRQTRSVRPAAAPTWAELGTSWAERFFDTFARVSFIRLSSEEKLQVYQGLADELVADVSQARPEWNSPANRAWWAAILKTRFGGRDFWMLTPKHKQAHCRRVGQEVELCAQVVTTQGILTSGPGDLTRLRPSGLVDA